MFKFKRKSILTAFILTLVLVSSMVSFADVEYTEDLCVNPDNISASSTFSGRTPDRAIDDNFTGSRDITSWHSGKLSSTSPLWLMYDFGENNSTIIGKYTITPGYASSHTPTEFTFQGSNDLNTWVDLDSHSNYEFEGFGITETFTFQNDQSFRYYRINVIEIKSYSQILLNEIEMMGTVTPDPVAPNAPHNLSATVDGDYIKLNWDGVEGAEFYTVYRSITSGGAITVLGTDITDLSFTDTNVEKGVQYFYYVTSQAEGLESPSSNQVSEMVPEPVLDNMVLRLYLDTNQIKEYELNSGEFADFLDWYEDARDGNDKPYYAFEKTYAIGAYKAVKDYIVFDKIVFFEASEY